jgi:hypothetical protein
MRAPNRMAGRLVDELQVDLLLCRSQQRVDQRTQAQRDQNDARPVRPLRHRQGQQHAGLIARLLEQPDRRTAGHAAAGEGSEDGGAPHGLRSEIETKCG